MKKIFITLMMSLLMVASLIAKAIDNNFEVSVKSFGVNL